MRNDDYTRTDIRYKGEELLKVYNILEKHSHWRQIRTSYSKPTEIVSKNFKSNRYSTEMINFRQTSALHEYTVVKKMIVTSFPVYLPISNTSIYTTQNKMS